MQNILFFIPIPVRTSGGSFLCDGDPPSEIWPHRKKPDLRVGEKSGGTPFPVKDLHNMNSGVFRKTSGLLPGCRREGHPSDSMVECWPSWKYGSLSPLDCNNRLRVGCFQLSSFQGFPPADQSLLGKGLSSGYTPGRLFACPLLM